MTNPTDDANPDKILRNLLVKLIFELNRQGRTLGNNRLNDLYVHFYDEEGADIGDLGLIEALHALQEGIHDQYDWDISHAVKFQIQTH